MLLKRALTFSLCLSFLSLPIGCQRDEEQILAKIGNQAITVDEFDREFGKVRLEYMSFNINDKKSLNRLKVSFLNKLIERKILLNEIQKLGVEVTKYELDTEISSIKKDYPGESFMETLISEYVSYEDWEERIRMKLLIEKLINEVIISDISIGDEEVKKYFKDHPEEFLIPEQVRARQIVVKTEVEAHEILKRLSAGEDFVKLAKEKSLSPDSEEGGDLGFFSRGHMPPEFDSAVFPLPTGKLSNIVKSPYGFHIFRVEEKREARKIFLYEVYDKIEKGMRQKRAEEKYDRWLKDIISMAKVEINHQLLEEINK